MALISNIGLGSGLDISSMVRQLVDAERAGPSLVLNRREAKAKSQISAVGQVKSAFDQLQTAVNRLKNGNLFDARRVESKEKDFLDATVAPGKTPATGRYQIEIESLAAPQKLQSAASAVAEAGTHVGEGTLRFTVGSASFDVVLGPGSNTIYNLASAINTAAGGKLQAAVVRGDDGFILSLTSGKNGSEGAISVAQTAGGSSLQAFTFDPDGIDPAAMSETTPPSDAVVYIDGVKRTSSSNTLGDAIDGVNLTLKQAEVGKTFDLVISEDSTPARQAIEGMVTAYNNTLKVLRDVSAYNPDTNVGAPLNGDTLVRGATTQLRNLVSSAFGAAAQGNIKLGIDSSVDGSLTFKTADFLQSLDAAPDALKGIFAGEDSVLTGGIASYLASVLGTEGSLTRRSDGLDAIIKSTARDREVLDRRMLGVEERYRKQFIALDGLLGKLNNTSQYLSQQLAGISSMNNNRR